MTSDELREIEKRAEAKTSFGFAFTHYPKDVLALLQHVTEAENYAKSAEQLLRWFHAYAGTLDSDGGEMDRIHMSVRNFLRKSDMAQKE